MNQLPFNPWYYHSDGHLQCYPSKMISNHIGIKIHDDYPHHYQNRTPEEIIKVLNKCTGILYNWYIKKYPKFKKIKLKTKYHKSDIVRGIISKFSYDDIKFYIEKHLGLTQNDENYSIKYETIEKKLNIQFGYIPSDETLDLIIEKKNL